MKLSFKLINCLNLNTLKFTVTPALSEIYLLLFHSILLGSKSALILFLKSVLNCFPVCFARVCFGSESEKLLVHPNMSCFL